MRVVVPRETAQGECRVAAVPESVRRLTDAGCTVEIERDAGLRAFVSDDAYRAAGARIIDDVAARVAEADVVLSVQPIPLGTLALVRTGAAVISLLMPSTYPDHVRVCTDRELTAFALELVPRTARAQPMDVLTSQAMVAGYRAALLAAERLPGFFPAGTTAAGQVRPAAVLVLGTGVAGLQALATARRLGAVTSAHDVRPSSADEVASLGATFLALNAGGIEGREGGYARTGSEDFLAAQRQQLHPHVGAADVVITTAAVPGRRAPLLVTAEMVEQMRPGSVIVDLAAETGGNCELTRLGESVEHHGVLVVAPRNAPSEVPRQASELFAANVANLLLLMTEQGRLVPDLDDDVLAACCVTRGGALVSAPSAPTSPAAGAAFPESTGGGLRRGSVDEVARLLAASRTVVLVPGYGLAVARAQHGVRALAEELERRGVAVTYAVHPVAGRFPGHLDAVLAEADVPYASMRTVEQANVLLPTADLALVLGANDVVNPAARSSPGAPANPLAGMPILDVDAARQVVVLKRTRRRGFADIDNPLLSDGRTVLLAGELRETVAALVAKLAAV